MTLVAMYLKGGDKMDLTLTAATWAWLLIPMPLLILLSVITYFTEKSTAVTYSIAKGEDV